MAQSVLKIGSALAERVGQGEVGGSTALADCARWLLQLAIEKAWSLCMAAVAAGYRKGLVSTGWPTLLLSCTNRHKKRA